MKAYLLRSSRPHDGRQEGGEGCQNVIPSVFQLRGFCVYFALISGGRFPLVGGGRCFRDTYPQQGVGYRKRRKITPPPRGSILKAQWCTPQQGERQQSPKKGGVEMISSRAVRKYGFGIYRHRCGVTELCTTCSGMGRVIVVARQIRGAVSFPSSFSVRSQSRRIDGGTSSVVHDIKPYKTAEAVHNNMD